MATTTTGAAVGLRPELGDDEVAVELVELAGRLVGEQHVGLDGQRPGHGDPLQLPAGELGDQPLGEVADTDPVQGRAARVSAASAGPTARARRATATFSSAVRLGTRP